jgi:GNAT superfamily N-acetyltransferase
MTSPPSAELRFQPVTPDRIADLATLFDAGDPKWCWCAWYRVRSVDFAHSTPASNRAVIERLAADTPAPGLVAYEGDEAVGWVSLGPRESFERLAFSRVLAPVDDTPVWSIVCFVVGRKRRGNGIAKALLVAAIEYARGHGATMLEAYPVDYRRRADRVGECLQGNAVDVRAGRVPRRRAAAGGGECSAAAHRAPGPLTDRRMGPTSSDAAARPSSVRVDTGRRPSLKSRPARKSPALV